MALGIRCGEGSKDVVFAIAEQMAANWYDCKKYGSSNTTISNTVAFFVKKVQDLWSGFI